MVVQSPRAAITKPVMRAQPMKSNELQFDTETFLFQLLKPKPQWIKPIIVETADLILCRKLTFKQQQNCNGARFPHMQ